MNQAVSHAKSADLLISFLDSWLNGGVRAYSRTIKWYHYDYAALTAKRSSPTHHCWSNTHIIFLSFNIIMWDSCFQTFFVFLVFWQIYVFIFFNIFIRSDRCKQNGFHTLSLRNQRIQQDEIGNHPLPSKKLIWFETNLQPPSSFFKDVIC